MSDLDKKYTIRLDLINNIQNEKMTRKQITIKVVP